MDDILTSEKFLDELMRRGIDFFCGVPDSVIGRLIIDIEKRGAEYLPATCEDMAVGVAVGAYLTGKRPCVLMQNSGLGNALDSYMTLAKLYKIPVLFLVSVPHVLDGDSEEEKRERANNIQHYDWEHLTKPLLDAVEFPYMEVTKESCNSEIAEMLNHMEDSKHPAALIIRKENVQ